MLDSGGGGVVGATARGEISSPAGGSGPGRSSARRRRHRIGRGRGAVGRPIAPPSVPTRPARTVRTASDEPVCSVLGWTARRYTNRILHDQCSIYVLSHLSVRS